MPIGPEVHYATEKKWDDLEIRIYTGADGKFVLYEDEFDNYNYENGAYSTITFQWDDTKKELTIEERKGSYPGMLEERKFNIVKVSADAGTGIEIVDKYDKVVTFKGKKVTVKL